MECHIGRAAAIYRMLPRTGWAVLNTHGIHYMFKHVSNTTVSLHCSWDVLCVSCCVDVQLVACCSDPIICNI